MAEGISMKIREEGDMKSEYFLSNGDSIPTFTFYSLSVCESSVPLSVGKGFVALSVSSYNISII